MTIPFRALTPLLQVTDLAASIAFYERLGFETANSFTPQGESQPVWAALRSGTTELMLSKASEPAAAGAERVMFYLYVDDVPAKHAELRAAGVTVGDITHAFYAPQGEFRVTDPDGWILMITHT